MSVCSTKAFTCQLAVLSLLTLKLARLGPMDKNRGKAFLNELITIPELIKTILNQKEKIQEIAKKYASFSNFFFLGRQYMFYSSIEAALKLKEISYLNANGYPAGELKHGPIALIDPHYVIVGLCGNALTYDKMLSNLTEVKARGGRVIAFVPEKAKDISQIADHILWMPRVSDSLASLLYGTSCQLFAYFIAKELGLEIDRPRNLAKSVTVE